MENVPLCRAPHPLCARYLDCGACFIACFPRLRLLCDTVAAVVSTDMAGAWTAANKHIMTSPRMVTHTYLLSE